MKKINTTRKYYHILIGFLIIFGFGYLLMWQLVGVKKQEIERELLETAEVTVAAINPTRLESLSGSVEDLKSTDYARLRGQLAAIFSSFHDLAIKWIYTMKFQDGQVVFLADSISENTFGHSEPGEVYQTAPAELFEVFSTGRKVITKPYIDDWGGFLSVFAPVRDSISKKIVGVVGVDLDYANYRYLLNRARILAMLITIAACTIFLIIYFYSFNRRRLLKKLEENEERLRAITTSILDAIVMIDNQGRITFWNESARRMFGYSTDEIRGYNLHKLIAPPELYESESSEALKSFYKTGFSPILGKIIEVQVMNKAGQRFPVELSVSSLKLNDEWYAVGVMRDISERRKLQDNLEVTNNNLQKTVNNLQLESAKMESLLSSLGDGVVACDRSGRIIFINQAAEKLLAYQPGEAVGKVFYEVLVGVDAEGKKLPQEKRYMYVSLVSGRKILVLPSDNYFYLRRDNRSFPVAATISPIVVNKEIIGAITVFRDVTHESDIDRMKTEFVSLVSHQLKNPATAIKYYLEMISETHLSKEQKELLESIGQINMNMIDLVKALLNVSRLESGRLMIDPQPTDLSKILKSVIKEVDDTRKAKKQKLEVKRPEKMPIINVDAKLIYEVYKNLLTNAIKYTPDKGKITITLEVTTTDVILAVQDTGYGIPKAECPRVFERFYRCSNIAKKEADGTGLGLYLVKEIVNVSGGKIWFESQEGQGSTFWVSLPLTGSQPKIGQVTIN